MEDPFEIAIDEILDSADGDVRRALRAILVENFRLQVELNRRDGLLEGEDEIALVLH